MNANFYIAIYFNLLLLIVIFLSLSPIRSNSVYQPYFRNESLAFILLLIVFLHIVFRPLDPLFGDTRTYAFNFYNIGSYGVSAGQGKDWGFQYLTYTVSLFDNLLIYWMILCALYVMPVYYAFKRNFPFQYSIALLLFICSFSFWGYGVNGLRNGIATSLIIYALMVPRKFAIQLLVMGIAFSFHSSVILPIGMFFISRYVKNTRYYMIGWVLCLILSIAAHSYFENLLANFSLFEGDDRLNSYLTSTVEDTMATFSRTGFRLDFMLYSLIPIFLGYVYIYKYNYEDQLYRRLYNIYLGCNAFWLLVVYVPYSNRFAYLSWFLYPIVLAYPLLKNDLLKQQSGKIKLMIFCNYLFTYLMWIK